MEQKHRERTPRSLDSMGSRAPRSRLDGGAPSSHTIDLRQATPKPARRAGAPVRPARPLPKPTPKMEAPVAVAPQPVAKLEPPQPVAKPTAKPVVTAATPTAAALAPAPNSDRRFWPAFWRFLFLLILLGLIVTGGLYLYLNYLRT